MTVRWRRSPSMTGRRGGSLRTDGANSNADRFAETLDGEFSLMASELL
jgi:hypothetical protein